MGLQGVSGGPTGVPDFSGALQGSYKGISNASHEVPRELGGPKGVPEVVRVSAAFHGASVDFKSIPGAFKELQECSIRLQNLLGTPSGIAGVLQGVL